MRLYQLTNKIFKQGQNNKAMGSVMTKEGAGGALLLAVGGTILFYSLYVLLWDAFHDVSMPLLALLFLSFTGFLFSGLVSGL